MIKTKISTLSLFAGALLFSVGSLQAATYNVTVNTSTLSGDNGAIDFQFNQGGASAQLATVQISNFAGGGPGTGQQLFGSAAGGPEPAAISLTNAAGDNEAFDSYTFANSLAFSLNFTGPAITSPAGNNTTDSLFTFTLYSDAAGTNEALTTNPDGALSITLNPEGALTSSINSSAVQIAQATPEPASIALISAPIALLALLRLRRRSA